MPNEQSQSVMEERKREAERLMDAHDAGNGDVECTAEINHGCSLNRGE